MQVSFIIPAHNEERLIGATLDAIRHAAAELRLDHEVIVACDGCTDGTERIARERGAGVVAHERRQIAATRNLGAQSATGGVLIFVDADTRVSREAIADALAGLAAGAVGGGGPVRFDGRVPLYARMLMPVFNGLFRLARLTGGCFLYCTRAAFDAAGGWDEALYASEEIWLAKALKGVGRFHITRAPVTTSGRKLRAYGGMEILWLMLKAGWRPRAFTSNRENLDLWYRPRPDPDAGKASGE